MYERELEAGIAAVEDSMRISRIIQKELTADDKIDKSDKSPVTIADFTSQAIICSALKAEFPDVPIVAEEDSGELRKKGNSRILKQIESFVKKDKDINRQLAGKNIPDRIDLGNGKPDNSIFWTLDPIDGTKGFLRGEQYAIALALIVKGAVLLGISGCPNLKLIEEKSSAGFIFYAIKGNGSGVINVETGARRKIEISGETDTKKMKFVESYESAHGNQELQSKIAKLLDIVEPPVQMDSQVKYGIVGSGNAEIYLRIPNPKSPDYKEKIWDHAAGSIIVEEAGGIVTDITGKKLNFSHGKNLEKNKGILATIPKIHKNVIDIIRNFNI